MSSRVRVSSGEAARRRYDAPVPSDAYYKGKTAEQILAELVDTGQVGSPVHEQQKMAIWVRMTEALTASLDPWRRLLATQTRRATSFSAASWR